MCADRGLCQLPIELWVTVIESVEVITDLATLCSVCQKTRSAGELLLSHWLRTQKLSTSVEVSELNALGFLNDRIHGELCGRMSIETCLTSYSTLQGARITDV